MQALEKLKWEKIANYVAAGVDNVQIAEALGLSEGRITQILSEPEFKQILQAKVDARVAQNTDLNDGWDRAEKDALEIVNNVLKFNKNPDFALRVALTANRATRRGGAVGNVPLPGRVGGNVVINLNQQFVGKLNMLQASATQPTLKELVEHAPQQKRVNLLAPGQVKKLLMEESENVDVVTADNIGEIKLA